MTDFVMGARVVCSDGFCGEVKRTILDPAARTVVLRSGRLVAYDELVIATGASAGPSTRIFAGGGSSNWARAPLIRRASSCFS